jgi:peptidoglycan/xylan/chitin deacetylase (PgdA/CDA1 family)
MTVIGVAPVMMRSPGGMDDFYVKNAVGYPIIHWSLASGDSGNGKAKTVAPRVLRQIGHGDIVLMHDLNAESPRYTELIVSSLAEQGYLLVTVEELFSAMGVPLEDNRVYFSPKRIDE